MTQWIRKLLLFCDENPAPTLRTVITDIDKDTSVDLDKAEERWMPIYDILSTLKEREIVKVNAGPHQHALDQSWMYIVVNQVLYNAIIQVLRSNGSLTEVQIDDAIYPITVMKSQRLHIERCIDHLMDKAILRRTWTYEEDKGDVYYYHLSNRGIVETHQHDDKQPLKPVDEVTETIKNIDAKAYMLRMLMNHSPEWIREDKLFDTVQENFTGYEDGSLKVLIMSLVDSEDSAVGYKNLAIPIKSKAAILSLSTSRTRRAY